MPYDPAVTGQTDVHLTSGHPTQPFLHDRVVALRAPSIAISGNDGQMVGGADGFFDADRRVVSTLEVAVGGATPAPIGHHAEGPSIATFVSVVRGLGEHSADPAVTLTRRREVHPGVLEDSLTLRNHGRHSVTTVLTIRVASDLATMEAVKSGTPGDHLPPTGGDGRLQWSAGELRVRVGFDAGGLADADPACGALQMPVEVPAGGSASVRLTVRVERAAPRLFEPPTAGPPLWEPVGVSCPDRRIARLVGGAMGDLDALLLCDPASSGPSGHPDRFLAAGAPWFLTLFGRDSLWAARMLLPLGTGLAAETLRVLARRQGTRIDTVTDEAPGKILHEVRRGAGGEGRPEGALPPCYYGTVDATALWLILLHDAWRWGMAPQEVEALLSPAAAALDWMRSVAVADPLGFLRYEDRSGRGLANQGWRDSGDSIRWADGRLASPPIALAEVQGYAHQAAVGAAEMFDHFGLPGADRWRRWAADLRDRFGAYFGLDDAGGLPATALDRDGGRVDSATSSPGHLLGTGILGPEGEKLVCQRLAQADLDSGLGLRTLATGQVGFNPLGYHTGSIWPHDTLIAARGAQLAGDPATAWSLVDGVLRSSEHFDARLPELYAGTGESEGVFPYPAACRPQAWAATAAVLALAVLLGLDADAPAGTVTISPLPGAPRPLCVKGLSVAGAPMEVRVGPADLVDVDLPAGIEVRSPVR